MNRKDLRNKSTFDLVVDTAKEGVLAGAKLEYGLFLSVVTFGTDNSVFEGGCENFKESTKGCREIGRRVGKNIFGG